MGTSLVLCPLCDGKNQERKYIGYGKDSFLSHRRLFNGLTVMIDLLVGVFKCCDLSHINAKVTKHKNSWTTKRHE
jgi:hypothetical protein